MAKKKRVDYYSVAWDADLQCLFSILITERALFPVLSALAATCRQRAQLSRMINRNDGHTCWQDRAKFEERFWNEVALRFSSMETALRGICTEQRFPCGVIKDESFGASIERALQGSLINESCPACQEAMKSGDVVLIPKLE